jgi:predicted TPR repeat methyltransferase
MAPRQIAPGGGEGEENAPVDRLLAEATASQLAGELDRAAALYQRVLEQAPGHAEALHRLGLLAQQQGQATQALALVERAVTAEPRSARYRLSLATVLHAAGDRPRAAASCRQALELDPGFAPAELELGMLASAAGDLGLAESSYRRAAELDPMLREAHGNLGVVLERQGALAEAIAAYRRALAVDPNYRKALANLGNACYRCQAWDEALAAYRRLCELDPSSGLGRHMVAALTGASPPDCPPDYVAALFDGCAESFEACLVARLGYATPQALSELLDAAVGPGHRFDYGIDLGCGTGLAGRALRGRCRRLVGVDLSANMLAQAARARIYDELHVAQNVAFLGTAPPGWDLVLAADVLPYTGDLAPCFAAVARGAAPGARFAFSTEASETDDYYLRRSGRYAHHPSYITRLAARHGLELEATTRRALRLERGEPVSGDVFVVKVAGTCRRP